MAPLPKRRHSTRRQGKRRNAIVYKIPQYQKCPNCGQPIMTHQACPNCGYYKGKSVIRVNKKTKSGKSKS